MSKNAYEKRKSIYNSLVRPNGKPLNDQDKLILDLLIHFSKNKKIGTTTYEYLLNSKFPNKTSKKTVNRTLKNISLYIYAKFKKKVIIEEITHRNKIAFCRVADFEQKMSTSTSNPCNNRDGENWTQGNIEVDKSQNENWTKTELDTSCKAEKQGISEKWTQGNIEVDKKRVEVDKNVQVHIEEGNINSSLKEEFIISEEKEKSRKKKKNNPIDKMSSSISPVQNLKTELAEKSLTAEFLEEAAITSYAYGGDKVLPQSKKLGNEFTVGSLALAKDVAELDTAECVKIPEEWLAKGKNDNAPSSLATTECFEAEQSISEEEHYQHAKDIPLPEIEEAPAQLEEAVATKPEVKSFSADKEEPENSSKVKQTLSCKDEDDAKWQSIHKIVLEKFKLKEELAYGILHNMTITAIRPNRIGLSFSRDLGFSEEDKEVLRYCLRYVYGPLIEMVIVRPDEDISSESAKLRVHLISGEDKRLPKGLKQQFKQLDRYQDIVSVTQKQEEKLIEPDEIRPANKEVSSDLGTDVLDHSLAFAKHKWNDVRQGILDGIYDSYAEQMENYLSNVEVLGMTGRILRLEAWWLTCDKMKDQQFLVEKIAKKNDVDLEIKNQQDSDIWYVPWTYPSHELLSLELGPILKKVN